MPGGISSTKTKLTALSFGHGKMICQILRNGENGGRKTLKPHLQQLPVNSKLETLLMVSVTFLAMSGNGRTHGMKITKSNASFAAARGATILGLSAVRAPPGWSPLFFM